ncbi:MAG: LysR family transcriptional regulator, partial [Pseudomonadota bacterium]
MRAFASLGAKELNWENVKTFAIVVQVGSVRRAAQELGVHHSTISRRIDALEYALGARLFDRQPGGYVLTHPGETLLHAVQSSGHQLNEAMRSVAGADGELSGVLTVTMAEPLAAYAFGPRLSEFVAQHKDIELRVLATNEHLDVSRREADIAIRMDNNPPETLVGKRMFPYYQTVYASPDYLDRNDLARNPEAGRWLGWDASEDRHPEWTKASEFPAVPVWGSFPNLALQVAAARGGLGLALLPCFLGDRETG